MMFYLAILFVIAQSEYISYIGHVKLDYGTEIDGLSANELSGITYNSDDDLYFAISDDLITNKGFYGFSFSIDNDSNQISLTSGPGIQMDAATDIALTSMDTESIVYIENPNEIDNSFYIVGQEGHRTYNTQNALYLYYKNGTYIDTMTDQLATKYLINNTQNNRGLEAMSVDIDQQYLVYSTELPLLSDELECSNCLRISINDFMVNSDDTVTLNQLYELRYDLDISDDADDDETYIGLSDIVIFLNQDDELNALTLEREVSSDEFANKIYLIDLSDNTDDISSCYSLSNPDCNEIVAVDKTLLFDFQSDINTDELPTQFGNFEALSILYNSDGTIYDVDGKFNLVTFNDNGDFNLDTYFLHLQYDPDGEPVEPETTAESPSSSSKSSVLITILSLFFFMIVL